MAEHRRLNPPPPRKLTQVTEQTQLEELGPIEEGPEPSQIGRALLAPELGAMLDTLTEEVQAGIDQRAVITEERLPRAIKLLQQNTVPGLIQSAQLNPPGAPPGIGGLAAAAAGIFGPQTLEESLGINTAELAQVRKNIQIQAGVVDNLVRAEYIQRWQIGMLTALPVMIQAGFTDEQILSRGRQEGAVFTDEERQFITDAITSQRAIADQQRTEGSRILDILQQTGSSLTDFLRLDPNQVSSEKLVRDLLALNIFKKPEGITLEEMRTGLINLGREPGEVDELLFDASAEAWRLSQELQAMDERYAALAEDGAKIRVGEIISQVKIAQWQRALAQPAIALLLPVEYWTEHFAQPGAGLALRLVFQPTQNLVKSVLHGNFSTLRERTEFERLVLEAQAEGDDTFWGNFQAHGTAFRNWDANWATKFLLEVVGDPLTYVGFGLAKKALSPFPALSRFAATAGAVEAGMTAIAEAPFTALKMGLQGLPRTIGLRSATMANKIIDVGIPVVQADLKKKGILVPWNRAPKDEITRIATNSIKAAAENPAGLGQNIEWGKGLLNASAKVITPDDVRALYRQLDITEELVPITRGLLDTINQVPEMTKGFGTTNWFTNIDESAQRLMMLLGLNDETALRRSRVWLINQKNKTINDAIRPFIDGENSIQQLRGSFQNMANNIANNIKSASFNSRYQQGTIASMINFGDKQMTRLSILGAIDRNVSQRAARAMLVFSFFTVFNAAEVAVKTMLAGADFFWKGRPGFGLTDKTALTFFELTGVPLSILTDVSVQQQFGDGTVMKQVITGRRDIHGNRIPIRDRVKEYVNTFNMPRTLHALGAATDKFFDPAHVFRNAREGVGDFLETVTAYNIGGRLQAAQMQNYHQRVFLKELGEATPETIQATKSFVDDLIAPLEGTMDKNTLNTFREIFLLGALTGDEEAFRLSTKSFGPASIHRGIVEEALTPFELLPRDVIDFLGNEVELGSMWTDAGIRDAREISQTRIYEHYANSPQAFENNVHEIIQQVLNEPSTTADEFFSKMQQASDTIDTFHNMQTNTLAAHNDHASKFKSSELRAGVYKETTTEYLGQIGELSIALENAFKRIKADLDSEAMAEVLDQSTRDLAATAIDAYAAQAASHRVAREAQEAVNFKFFNTQGERFGGNLSKDNSIRNSFWDDHRAETKLAWAENESTRNFRAETIFAAEAQLAGSGFSPKIANLKGRAMKGQDVADLYGIHLRDLETSIFQVNLMALDTLESFVSKTRARAAVAARQRGVTLEDMGWTDNAIAQVYEELTAKIKTNPRDHTGMEPMTQQLDAAFMEIESIRMRRQSIINDDNIAAIQEVSDTIADNIWGKRTHSAVFDTEDFRLVPRTVTDPREPLALPSGESRITEQNSLLRAEMEAVEQRVIEVQSDIDILKLRIRDSSRRQLDILSVEIGRLRDRGVDISTLDGVLNNYRDIVNIGGSSVEARRSRDVAWQRVLDNLNTLDQDIDASVRQAAEEIRLKFAVGTPDSLRVANPLFAERLRDAGLDLTDSQIVRLENLSVSQLKQTRTELRELLGNKNFNLLLRKNFLGRRKGNQFVIRRDVAVEEIATQSALARVRHNVDTSPFRPPAIVLDKVVTRATAAGRTSPSLREENLRFLATDAYQQIRQDAMNKTNIRKNLDFPDWDNQTALSSTMKILFPFWAYESHRWAFYLPREVARHPGVWATWGKYINNTDEGYINVPGTPVDVNPLRGTILGGGFRRLMQRDYPEFYDQFPGISGFQDYISKWGFFPGIIPSFFQAYFGAKVGGPQLGELLPATAKNLILDIPTAIAPEATAILRDVIFPDKFRDLLVAKQVTKSELDKEDGVTGTDILIKRLLNLPLLPEEEKAWNDASRTMARWQGLFEQTGIFRFRPEEIKEVRLATSEIIEKMTGIPIEQIEDLRRTGISIEEAFDIALSPEIKRALKVIDKWRQVAGLNVGLQPSQQGIMSALTTQYWEGVQGFRDEERAKLLVAEDDFRANIISLEEWERVYVEGLQRIQQSMKDLRATDLFKDVPITIDERRKVADERGIKIFFHPIEETIELFYEKELKQVWDEDTQTKVWDFDGLFRWQDVIEGSVLESQAGRMRDLTNENKTPLTLLRFNVRQNFIAPYNAVRDAVIGEFEEEDRKTIRQYLRTRAIQQQAGQRKKIAEFKIQTIGGTEDLLISTYEDRVKTIRQNLREADPELDAWLFFFKKTTSFKTQAAEDIHDEKVRIIQEEGFEAVPF